MNKSKNILLVNLENKYLDLLFDYCKSQFRNHHLPSHDHYHHLRVWTYARDLILEHEQISSQLNEDEIFLLMLSVFFHDTGLIVTLSEDHGKESRKLCADFLKNTPGLPTHDPAPALEAIELHDKKESVLPGTKGADILKILTVCDDADAYGAIGVLRYTEIYLLRNINLSELPLKVIKNLDFRYKNLTRQKWLPKGFIKKQKERYHFTRSFFSEMDNSSDDTAHCTANRIITSLYMKLVYQDKYSLSKFCSYINSECNPVLNKFSTTLMEELTQSNCSFRANYLSD